MTDSQFFAAEGAVRLRNYGFDDRWQEELARVAGPAESPGRVLRADLGACLVALERGDRHLPLHPALASSGEVPTTGDFVTVVEGAVRRVLPRRTALTRASVREGAPAQVLAANVEFVLVAEPLGERLRPRRIERLLVVAWQSGAIPIVVLTKADSCTHLDEALATATALAPGVSVHAVSSLSGWGLDGLAEELVAGTTAVIVGRSGAGKSTLANALHGGELLETSPIRADGKGRHTTVTRELVPLVNGALLIDTPGLRAVGLGDARDGLEATFDDVESLSVHCRFSDCSHGVEPGCAVLAAIQAGGLERSRLDSYRRLMREQERLEARHDPRLRAAREARWRQITKQSREPRR